MNYIMYLKLQILKVESDLNLILQCHANVHHVTYFFS